jgi:mannose/cellobiose epimerase-like protein (N-acyl-D-glucosamine 2-epimerase family)
LNDITNVAGSRASQAYSKVGKQSIVAEATARAELALSSAQTASNENAQNVSEYAAEIYANAFRDEAAYLARSNYMESQADINGKMRAILIDWLVEVHLKYNAQ